MRGNTVEHGVVATGNLPTSAGSSIIIDDMMESVSRRLMSSEGYDAVLRDENLRSSVLKRRLRNMGYELANDLYQGKMNGRAPLFSRKSKRSWKS